MVHVTHAMLHGAWRAAHRPTRRYHRVLARAEADAEETDHKVSELTEQVLRCASQARLPPWSRARPLPRMGNRRGCAG